MKLYKECSFESFEPWSGAISTHERICNAGKAEAFEAILEDAYPEGLSETGLNDMLWFEPEWCYEMVGLRTETEIREEIEEKEERIEELKEEFKEDCEECIEFANEQRQENGEDELTEEEIESFKAEKWALDYESEVENLKAEINDLKEELGNIY